MRSGKGVQAARLDGCSKMVGGLAHHKRAAPRASGARNSPPGRGVQRSGGKVVPDRGGIRPRLLARGDGPTALAALEPLAALTASAPIGPPGTLRTHELLAEALLAAGRPAEAVAAWERSLELTPNRRASVLGLERARTAL
jgi:hypothetical protein